MARNDPTIYMRIPQELKEKLDAASAENRRSLTSEVVARLQSTFGATLQGSLGGLQMTAAEESSLTPEQLKLAREIAAEAVKQVVLQAQGSNALEVGTPGVVQKPVRPSAKKS